VKRYLLDVDTGTGTPGADHDDGLALGFALRAGLPILGITTSPGNVTTEIATCNTLRLLEQFGHPHIPVARGRDDPLLFDASPIRAFYDAAGETEIARRLWAGWNLPEPKLQPSAQKAHDFIIECARQYPREVTLILCASLTNLAMAILAEPQVVELLNGAVCMGLMIADPNPFMAPLDRPPRYMNDSYDSDATEIVTKSGLPITFVTADVAFKVPLLRSEDLERIAQIDSRINHSLARMLEPWIAFVKERYGMAGCGLPDVLAVAVAIDPTLVTTSKFQIDMARFRLGESDRYPYLVPGTGGIQVDCAVDVDGESFMELFFNTMAGLKSVGSRR